MYKTTNGIHVNVLCNPQLSEMVNAINKALDGYNVPSSRKSIVVLLDESFRDVEKKSKRPYTN